LEDKASNAVAPEDTAETDEAEVEDDESTLKVGGPEAGADSVFGNKVGPDFEFGDDLEDAE
jgi:hypothetical protein